MSATDAGNVTAVVMPDVTGPVTTPDAKTGAEAAPKFLRPNFERMPDELKQLKNWVLWVAIWNGSKWTKRPIQTSGFGASTTNPKHWASFEEVKRAYERAEQGSYIDLREKDKPPQRVPIGGVGFVFDGQPDEEGLVIAGVDFDGVISSAGLASLAQERIRRLGSYTERSVSDTGLHVIVKAQPLPSAVAHKGVELYTRARFFTMTGCAPEGAQVIAAPDGFAALAEELRIEAGCRAISNISSPTINVVPFKLPEWAVNTRPAAAFANLPVETLAAGFEPNIEEIRAVVAAIPSSEIETEPEWMRLARALAHEAAVHKGYTEQLWEVLDITSRRAPGYNQEENRRRFERYINEALNRSEPITIATLYHMALTHGWDGRAPSNIASTAVTAPLNQSRAVHISSLPLIPPKRKWLHGADLIRGAVTILVAPGGRAKSTWLLACALACASGRPLLGSHIFGGPLRVLCLSTEDGLGEMTLRLRAAMQHFELTDADLPELYIIGAERWGFALLQANGNRAVLDERGMNALNTLLDDISPDVLIIDPLINVMGGVSANDNAAAALLMEQLVGLAIERAMAVALAHHTSKGRDVTSAESAMGAASFTNLARIALSIEPLDPSKAGEIGLPPWEAGSLFRVIPTKQNFSPPSAKDRWFRLVSVTMPNAEPPIYMDGDKVAVVEPFKPGASGPAFPHTLVRDALRAVDAASPPLTPSKRSRERYAAPVIAHAIKGHRSGQASEVDGKAVLDHLMSTGLVVVTQVKVPRDDGKGADTRKGLVLTPAGKVALQQAAQVTITDPAPQSPQTPATTLQDDAGGDPLGSPATQGGCGGNAGGDADEANAGPTEDQK
jgi:AAA domain/Primase C terminal 2 (PriCT-2)